MGLCVKAVTRSSKDLVVLGLCRESRSLISSNACVQVLANFLSTPLASGHGGDAAGWPYVAFDLDPGRVKVLWSL